MGGPHNYKKVGNSQKRVLTICWVPAAPKAGQNKQNSFLTKKHEANMKIILILISIPLYLILSIIHIQTISSTLSHNTFILFLSPPPLSLSLSLTHTHTHTYLLNAQLLHPPYHTLSPYTANPYSTIFRMAALLPILLQNSSHLSIYSLA